MSGWDYLVIGGQKCGTTTLHHLLSDNPRLAQPRTKEAPLFLREVSEADVRRHVVRHVGAPDGRLTGKATPAYMCHPGVAARIAAANPSTRLIAVLRDPIERARSHWRMQCSFGTEHRPFAVAMNDALTTRSAHIPTRQEDGYVAWGEYGRILEGYLSVFPRDQLHVLCLDDLEADPVGTISRICDFLGVDPHVPRYAGTHFNVGHSGGGPSTVANWVWRLLPYRQAWRRLPVRLRVPLAARLDRLDVRRPETMLDQSLPSSLLERLESHFACDADRLRANGFLVGGRQSEARLSELKVDARE